LELLGLEFLTDLNGQKFETLPRNILRRIKAFPIVVYILEHGTPLEVKYNIFSRVNQGGLELKPQEIRHALHQGKGGGAEFVKALVTNDSEQGKAFYKVTEGKVKAERMQDRDFATRFLYFYILGYENYEPDMHTFMNKGMSAVKKISDEEKESVKHNFAGAMETAYEIFGNDAFRKRFNKEENRKPINKALFEVLSVLLAKLSDENSHLLVTKKEQFKNKMIALHQDQKFVAAISQGTADREKYYTDLNV